MRDFERMLFLLSCALAVAGCGASDSAGGNRVILRDSAGVRVAENTAAFRDGPLWRIDSLPRLELGRVDGEGPDLFGSIRQVLRLRTGEIAVADGIALEIRLFDETGHHLRTFGRRGEGPGEFLQLWTIGELPGDSIAAVDNLNGRVSVFGADGTFARSFPLPRVDRGMAPNIVGWLRDGTVVLSALAREPVGDFRNVIVYTTDREGRSRGTVGDYRHWQNGRNGLGVAFDGQAELAVGDSLIWYGHSSHFELLGLDRVGALHRIIRDERTPRAISDDDIARAQAAARESMVRQGASPAALQRVMETEFAKRYPVHGALTIDRLGHLWTERYRNHLLPDDSPPEWDVFDPEGRLLGSLTMPDGFRITQVGADFLLGVHTDAVGVERVRMYGLVREGLIFDR